MELLRVRAQNFLSLGSMSLELNNQGLILLEGNNLDSNGFKSNGSGKSSILESITYALYGKLSNGTAGDNVVNRQVGKDTYVILDFKIDNTNYRVERYRKHKEFKNKVLLFINDEERTQASIKETNAMIQEIISIDITTYLNSIIFGQGEVKKFSQSTDKEKKALLEDIANITIYKKAQDKAKVHRDEVKSQLAVETASKQGKEQLYTYLVNQKETADKAYEESLQYKASLKDRVDGIKKRLAEAKKVLPTKDSILALQTHSQELQSKLSNLSAPPKVSVDTMMLSQLDNEIINESNKLKEYSDLITKVKTDVKTLLEAPNPVCQYCGSLLNDEHKQQEIDRLLKSAQEAQSLGLQLKEQLPNKKLQSKELHEKYDNEVEIQAQSQATISRLYQERQATDSKLSSIETIINNISSLEAQLDEAKQLYKDYKSNKPKSLVKDVNQAKKDLEKAQEAVEEVSKKLNEFNQVVEVYSNKGVRSHIMDLVTPYLTQQANKYLSILTDGTLSVIIGVNEETDSLELQVNNINGANNYELNSKGEKKRIDLAISLAMQDYVMSRSNIKPSFIGYDEVFDGLDGVGIERIMTVLKGRIKDIPSIFVISHNSNLKELFENTIMVEKKGGMAHVITQE